MPSNPTHRGWTLVHTRILKLALSGKSYADIARKVGMSQKYVSALAHSDEYKERFEYQSRTVLEKVQAIFESGAESAAKTIKKISKKGKPDERVRLDAAKDIIDRVGYKPVQIIETRQRAYTPQEIESARGTVRELEDTLIRLERKDSIFVLKKPRKSDEKPINLEPDVDARESTSEPSSDRPQTVSA